MFESPISNNKDNKNARVQEQECKSKSARPRVQEQECKTKSERARGPEQECPLSPGKNYFIEFL